MARVAQKSLTLNAAEFRAGDRVMTIDREATPDETKQRIFYNHMRNLSGTVRRVYEEENEVWVEVDQPSLPEAVRVRHKETEVQMRQKWLDGLSDEARRKLGSAGTSFALRYSILVSPNHLILMEKGDPSLAPVEPAPAVSSGAPITERELDASEREFLDRAENDLQPE